MNNVIALSGKQGVMIMLNGKISRLPMEAVVQMLGGMNAENIERIELITTPPSKYEAQGDAGMINIVMKKMEDKGTNGSISLLSGMGRGTKYGGTLNLNSRGKKLNFFGDLTLRDDNSRQYFNTRWDVPINNQLNQTNSDNDRKSYTGVKSGGIGFDWSASKKTTIGGLFNVFDRRWDMDAWADITRTVDQNPFYKLKMNTIEKNDWRQFLGNINLKHEFSKNFSVSIDADQINFRSANPTTYFQNYFDNLGNPTTKDQLRSSKDTDIQISTTAIDFTGKINEKINIEFGAKGSFTKLNNDIVVDKIDNGAWLVDNGLTSYATMYENILAGYSAVAIKATKKLDIQAGLRYEHTQTHIDTRAQPNVVDRDYGNWFPSMFVNHKINDNNSWVISYSKRISRPSFQQLAPFVIFNDPNNFFSGNIALFPASTDALKAEFRHKSILISLQYSYDKSSITQFQPRINADNKQVSTAQNLDYRQNISVVLSFPIQITKWWEMQLNSTASSYSIKASYTDTPIYLSITNFSFNGSQKFKISKSVTAEITGFYESPQLFGIMEFGGFGSVDFGIEKKFKNSSLRASYSDMFANNKWGFTTNIRSEKLNSRAFLDFETTIATITYSINFGNNKLKTKGPRKTGSKEEQERL